MKISLRLASLFVLLSVLLSMSPAFTQDEFDVLNDTVITDEIIDESKKKSNSIKPEDSIQSAENYVEIRTSHDIFLPYKQRQNIWGFSFSIGAEQVDFPKLQSQFDNNYFQSLFGSSGLTMMSLEMGPKYNFTWGSLSLLLGYGQLSKTDSRIGVEAGIDISRYSATGALYFDNIWEEPYFVPYLAVGAWQSDYAETTANLPDDTRKYSTEIGYHMRVGALFGLDWLEPSTALRARKQLGIKGVFINTYASSSFMSESAPDPNLENEYDLGATLVFEY